MEISALPLFRGVPAEELPALLARASARTCAFQKGELLLRRGDVRSEEHTSELQSQR